MLKRSNNKNHLASHTQGQAKVVTGAWNHQVMVEKQFQINRFYFLRKVFNHTKESISNCWRSHRESTFANIQLRFRNKKLDVLRVLEISEKCSRLTKYVGC